MRNPGIANRPSTREKRRVQPARQLFVDGYNILHAWQWLTARDSSAARGETARGKLVESLRVLHDVDGLAVTLVFDGPGASASADAAVSEPGYQVVYAPADRTADGVIEAMVAAARDPQRCTVATADAMERETVTAAGASCISPEELQAWCERSRTRAVQAAARARDRTRGTWGNKLPL